MASKNHRPSKKEKPTPQVAQGVCCSSLHSSRISNMDELLKGMRQAGAELAKTRESASAYLLSTGFYDKKLRLKKQYQ